MLSANYLLLVQRAEGIVQGGYELPRMTEEASAIATEFSKHAATPLTPEAVLGLMFSLVTDTEEPPVTPGPAQ